MTRVEPIDLWHIVGAVRLSGLPPLVTRKFFIIPKVCDVTKKRIWLEHGYEVSVELLPFSCHPIKTQISEKGYTILALKGEI